MPRSARVVELEVELRDPLQPQPLAELVAHERHRAPERAIVACRVGRPTDDATHTLAWRRSGVVSTLVTVTNPIRGIGDLPREDGADLLAQQLVEPLGSLGHRCRRRQRGSARDDATRVCW